MLLYYSSQVTTNPSKETNQLQMHVASGQVSVLRVDVSSYLTVYIGKCRYTPLLLRYIELSARWQRKIELGLFTVSIALKVVLMCEIKLRRFGFDRRCSKYIYSIGLLNCYFS